MQSVNCPYATYASIFPAHSYVNPVDIFSCYKSAFENKLIVFFQKENKLVNGLCIHGN